MLKSTWNYSYFPYAELRILAEKINICFYKNFTKQTFAFDICEVSYFMKHLAYQV